MATHHSLILVDGHVHIYDCFDLPLFLDAAFQNFAVQANKQKASNSFIGILLLTETLGVDRFAGLIACADARDGVENKRIGSWKVERTAESCSLLVRRETGEIMILIAGRQIVTAEKLEVLALATDKSFVDGAPLQDIIAMVKDSGAIPVLPWGAGKWLGRRAKILKQLINASSDQGFFLGDSGGRPTFWRRPSLLKLANEVGIRILSGTDPLPLASDASRPGTFGFALSASLSLDQPARDIKHLLGQRQTELKCYGRLQSPYQFFRSQLLIRLK